MCIVATVATWIKIPLVTEVSLGPGDIVSDEDPAPLPKKGAEPSSQIFGPCLLWPNGWMDQDGAWRGGGPWPRPHCAVDGDPAPVPKLGQSPQFSAYVYSGQTAGWTTIPLGMEVNLGPDDFVFDGTQLPPEKGQPPPNLIFWPMFIVAKRLTWIKMPLCTVVNLGPGDVVLDGIAAPP